MSYAVASNRSASQGLVPDPSWRSVAGEGLRERGQVDRGARATILRQRRRQLPSPTQFLWAGPLRRLERLWRVVMTSSSCPARRPVDEGFPASGVWEGGVPWDTSNPSPTTLSEPPGETPGYSGSGQNRPRSTAARPRGEGLLKRATELIGRDSIGRWEQSGPRAVARMGSQQRAGIAPRPTGREAGGADGEDRRGRARAIVTPREEAQDRRSGRNRTSSTPSEPLEVRDPWRTRT